MNRKESERDAQIIFLSADPIAALGRREHIHQIEESKNAKFAQITQTQK
jgi:hypothetical protein